MATWPFNKEMAKWPLNKIIYIYVYIKEGQVALGQKAPESLSLS
jgi:uncharacterized membrane protein SirB2